MEGDGSSGLTIQGGDHDYSVRHRPFLLHLKACFWPTLFDGERSSRTLWRTWTWSLHSWSLFFLVDRSWNIRRLANATSQQGWLSELVGGLSGIQFSGTFRLHRISEKAGNAVHPCTEYFDRQ